MMRPSPSARRHIVLVPPASMPRTYIVENCSTVSAPPLMPADGPAAYMRKSTLQFRRTAIAWPLCLAIALLAAHDAVHSATGDEVRALWVRRTSLESEE